MDRPRPRLRGRPQRDLRLLLHGRVARLDVGLRADGQPPQPHRLQPHPPHRAGRALRHGRRLHARRQRRQRGGEQLDLGGERLRGQRRARLGPLHGRGLAGPRLPRQPRRALPRRRDPPTLRPRERLLQQPLPRLLEGWRVALARRGACDGPRAEQRLLVDGPRRRGLARRREFRVHAGRRGGRQPLLVRGGRREGDGVQGGGLGAVARAGARRAGGARRPALRRSREGRLAPAARLARAVSRVPSVRLARGGRLRHGRGVAGVRGGAVLGRFRGRPEGAEVPARAAAGGLRALPGRQRPPHDGGVRAARRQPRPSGAARGRGRRSRAGAEGASVRRRAGPEAGLDAHRHGGVRRGGGRREARVRPQGRGRGDADRRAARLFGGRAVHGRRAPHRPEGAVHGERA